MIAFPMSFMSGRSGPSLANLALWLAGTEGVYEDGAAVFASASSQSLSVASNSTLQTGGGEFWWAGWVNVASLASCGLFCKGSFAGYDNVDYSVEFTTSGYYFRFTVGTGSSYAGISYTAVTASPSTWYFVLCWYDAAAGTINISVNGGPAASISLGGSPVVTTYPLSLGSFNNAGAYFNGSLDSVAFGKSPPGGIASVINSIASTLYNSGNGLTAAGVTSAQQTAWGLVSWWDFDSSGNLGLDSVGSNTLTNNNGVTQGAGIVEGLAVDGDPVSYWGPPAAAAGLGLPSATQTAIASRFAYKASDGPNSTPCVKVSGSTEYMALGSSVALTGEFTFYLTGYNADSSHLFALNGSNDYIGLYNGDVYFSSVYATYTGTTGNLILRIRRDASNNVYAAATGMTETLLGNLSSTVTLTAICNLYGAYFLAIGSFLSELSIYTADTVASGQDAGVLAYLKAKYGLTLP